MMSNSERYNVWWVLCLSFLLKILWVLFTRSQALDFGDTADYVNAATSIVDLHKYPDHGYLPFFRAPFYPLYIAFFYLMSKTHFIFILVMSQCLLSALTGFLLYKVAKNIFSYTVALSALIIFSFHPLFFVMSGKVQSETLFVFLTAVVLYLLIYYPQLKNGSFCMLLSGIFSGLAILTRPAGVIFLPTVLIGCVSMNPKQLSKITKHYFMFILGVLLVLSPWIFRNYQKYGEVIFSTDAGGFNFFIYNSHEYYDLLASPKMESYKKNTDYVGQKKWKDKIQYFERREGYSSLSPQSKEALWYQEAFDYIYKNKLEYLRLLILKAGDYLRLYLHPYVYGSKMAIASFLYIGFFMLTGLAGICLAFFMIRNKRREISLLVAYFLFSLLTHAAYVSSIRMRIVFIDIWIYMFSAFAIVFLLNRFSLFTKKIGER